VKAHVVCMVLTVLTSVLFLATYLVYHYHAGSVAFRNGGLLRIVYFTILLSHTVLATFGIVPLVVLTLIRALSRDFARHRRIAQVTFPIWLYVSITGVVIYVMLHHFPVIATSVQP
jgi:protein SCO1